MFQNLITGLTFAQLIKSEPRFPLLHTYFYVLKQRDKTSAILAPIR